jgi:hypothetical protein
LLERFAGGHFLLESGGDFRVALCRPLCDSEAFCFCALFGRVQSTAGVNKLFFEPLVIRKAFNPLRVQLRKALGGCGGISGCFLSGVLEGRFDFAQSLVNQGSSRSRLRQARLMLDLLVGKPRHDRRHVRGVALLGVANGCFGFGDLVTGNREGLLERPAGGGLIAKLCVLTREPLVTLRGRCRHG